MADGLTPENDAPREAPRGALGTIFLIVFMDLLGFGIIIPLLPFYVPAYQDNPLKVTFLFSIYSICQFIGAPILGLISDRFGRRPVLALSQAGSALGYLLLAVVTQLHFRDHAAALALVYLSRVIDGFTGGNISTAQAYISDVTSHKNRAKGMALLGVAFGVGFSAGPAIGGILGSRNPSLPAYVAALCSLTASVFCFLRLPESRSHTPADAEAWLHPSRFAPVLRKPVLLQLLAISFFIMAAFVMMESTIALYLDKTFHYTPREIGWFFAFAGLVIIVVQGGLVGRLTAKFGEWPLAIIGPLLVAIGMTGYTLTSVHPMLSLLLLASAVNAAGRSLQQPTISSLISKFSDPREQGVVFGLYHGLGSLARVAGPIVAGLTYPHLRNTGQFVTAGVIVLMMAAWTASVRTAPAPEPGRAEVPLPHGEPHATVTEPT